MHFGGTAAIRMKKGMLRVPTMLRTIFHFLAERVSEGGSLQSPPEDRSDKAFDVTFYTDAKATDTEAWIGGYLRNGDGKMLQWFFGKG